MPEEIFDIVDENNRVIGQRPRSEVHQQGLRHRAVHILVFHPNGSVYLQKRAMTKDINPGMWDSSAAGHLESGEAYDAAAIRELEEELGVRVEESDMTRLYAMDADRFNGMEFINVYKVVHPGPFQLQTSEIDAGEWFTPEQLAEWVDTEEYPLTQCFRIIWQRYLALPK